MLQTTRLSPLTPAKNDASHFPPFVPVIHRICSNSNISLDSLWSANASNRVRLAFIGTANRGGQLIDAFKAHSDAEIVAVCDIDSRAISSAVAKLDSKVETQSDFRKLLERKDIDAFVIATPDHWHAIQMTHACAAGKDVYVEKPLSVTVQEGRKMWRSLASTTASCKSARTDEAVLSIKNSFQEFAKGCWEKSRSLELIEPAIWLQQAWARCKSRRRQVNLIGTPGLVLVLSRIPSEYHSV